MDVKVLISFLAILLSFIGYFIYIRSILKGKTKPHAFSWFVWGVLTVIVLAAQFTAGAGFGIWITGFTALACFAIAALALKYDEISFPVIDWLCLIGAFIAIGFWVYMKDPMWAVVLITLADFITWIPTIRKAYVRPYWEHPVLFGMCAIKFFLSLFALTTFNLSTALYSIYLTIMNSAVVAMILIRRKQVSKLIKK